MNNSELRAKLNQYISNKRFDLEQIAELFGQGSEELAFAEKFNTRNSMSLAERLNSTSDIVTPEPTEVFSQADFDAKMATEPKTITIESPVGFEDMYTSYEVEEITAEAIDALEARKQSLNYGVNEIDYAVSCHISELKAAYGKDTGKVSEFKRLLEIGNRLFEQGYRLRETDRVFNGVNIQVPSNAIMWRDVDAYYISTAAAHKIVYVVKV